MVNFVTANELKFVVLIILCTVVFATLERMYPKSSRRRLNQTKTRRNPSMVSPSGRRRPDEEILTTPLNQLTWSEFERLLALYFRDEGYAVEETGIGGNDGGVDLVLLDERTNERTAVQIKWRSKSSIGPEVIRELHSARWNTTPRCLYAMLITNSDITQRARAEAAERHIEYWNGPLLELKLDKWDKWEPSKKKRPSRNASTARREVAASTTQFSSTSVLGTTVQCVCGAPMVQRKNKQGKAFWGCSKYPACKRTRDTR